VAVDNVKFLAIDAVEQNQQIPPLPPGVGLSREEFYNVARESVNAYDYVRTAWRHNRVLQETWDVDYRAPNVPLIDGMKRCRPLGNLVFRIQSQQVEGAVRTALNQVLAINPDQWRSGSDGGRAKVPVFIVASCAGGTGSSGFLHVLHAVHRATIAAGVTAEVYPVIFLPDVFARARQRGLDPASETRGHWANAYAFLAELDLVLSEPLAFDDLLCPPHQSPTNVETIDVVKSAFLIDGRLTDGGQFDERDAFDIAATGVHSLLVTEVRSLIGVEGVNNDSRHFDAEGARTAYAGIGALKIVYPGSTYRRYLRARLKSFLLQDYLVDESASVSDRSAPLREKLTEQILGLREDMYNKAYGIESARRLRERAAGAADEVGDPDLADDVGEHMLALLDDASKAGRDLQSMLPDMVRQASSRIDGVIDRVIIESGEGIEVLRFAVDKVKEQLTTRRNDDETKVAAWKSAMNGLQEADEGSLSGCLRRVSQAHDRVFFLRRGELKPAVKAYAEASDLFAKSLIASNVGEAQLTVLTTAIDRLSEVQYALKSAAKVLREEKDDADLTWRDDAFEGKDVGGLHVMGVVPSDVASTDARIAEVEDSAIARGSWERLVKLLADDTEVLRKRLPSQDETGSQWLNQVYEEWWRLGKHHGVRGLVTLGQGDIDAQGQDEALELLRKVLDHQINELGRVDSLLPSSLEAAAGMADAVASGDVYEMRDLADFAGEETAQLNALLRETMQRAGYVTVQLDPAKIRLQNDDPLPSPVKTVAASGAMRERLAALVPDARVYESGDPEQVKSVSVQMSFPLAALEGLGQWHRNYQRVQATRRVNGQRSSDPPPHLDTRFAAAVTLRPVAVRDYSDHVVAEFVVQGSALMLLSSDAPDLVARFGNVAAISTQYGDRGTVIAYGQPMTVVNDRTQAAGDRIRLGSSAAAVFDAVGASPKFQVGTNEVFDYLLARAKADSREQRPELLTAIQMAVEQYRAINHANAAKLPQENPSEEVVRERQVRLALDTAAGILLGEVAAAPLGDAPPPL
jgi:hypothetical protein